MSSKVLVKLVPELELSCWLEFCLRRGIGHVPGTGSRHVFYPKVGSVIVRGREFTLGEVMIVAKADKALDTLEISCQFCSNLEDVARTARDILAHFGGTISSSPEMAHMVVDLPHHYDRDPYLLDYRLSTDDLSGWCAHGQTLSAQVEAGMASIRSVSPGLHALELDGILRAHYPAREDAMLAAGRMHWNLWGGSSPEVFTPEQNQLYMFALSA